MRKAAVIGGGAAGMMTAVLAAGEKTEIHLYEKNEKLGKKLFITGKGRCNVTNDCPTEEFFTNVVTNPKFLYSSAYSFDSAQVQEFFEAAGVRLLRVGLCATEAPTDGVTRILAGASHPALGELARNVMFLRRMRAQLRTSERQAGEAVTIAVARGKRSQAIGQHRRNLEALCREFSLGEVHICEEDTLCATQVRVLKS